LAGQPYKGRNGRVEGTRELVIHPHFVLVYEVDSQWGKVYILRVTAWHQKFTYRKLKNQSIPLSTPYAT
ncbi:type II toxin-antitoxin system RelE/ParE family toxin, partial [Escherichia coli]